MPILYREALPEDHAALEQLLELYQYELCETWPQDMDANGRYGYDLARHKRGGRSRAFVAREGVQCIGFALTAPAMVTRTEGTWMEQFFIHRRHRRSGAGRELARHVWAAHPGPWEIGQMAGNGAAQAFWRAVIGEFTGGRFTELQVTEGWWQGVVQQFEVPAAA